LHHPANSIRLATPKDLRQDHSWLVDVIKTRPSVTYLSPSPLLCEFARKKENPPVKWYLKPLLGTVSYVLTPASDAPPTIGSCSAELPVIRGRGHSHASRCLFVRDQETSLRFILLTVLAGCRHQESNEVAVATLFMPARVGPDPWRVPLPSFLSLYSAVLLGGKSHASCHCAV